jgi:hypothetical protein
VRLPVERATTIDALRVVEDLGILATLVEQGGEGGLQLGPNEVVVPGRRANEQRSDPPSALRSSGPYRVAASLRPPPQIGRPQASAIASTSVDLPEPFSPTK